MADLSLQLEWRPASGEPVKQKLAAGEQLASDRLPGAFKGSFPLLQPVEGGWVLNLPKGAAEGKVVLNGQPVELRALRQKQKLGDHPKVERLRVGATVGKGQLKLAGGVLAFAVHQAAGASASAAGKAAATPSEKRSAAPATPEKTAAAPATKSGGAGQREIPPRTPPTAEERRRRQRGFWGTLVVMVLLHVGVMALLGARDVPEDEDTDPSKIPERFAELIVPDQEEEEEESGEGSEAAEEAEAPQEEEVQEEPADEPAGGGDEEKDTGAPSEEEMREKVRETGVLAVLGSKKRGGALGDVLSDDGLAGDLDQALSDVGGVAQARRGMDIRGKRGKGGGDEAGIGDLAAGKGRGVGLGDKGSRKVKAGVQTESFTSQGSLDADAIRQVVQKHIRGVKFCYEKQLANNPELEGKVVIRFTIGESGRVTKFDVEDTTLNNAEVEACILKRVRRWRFPQPDEGPVTVSYPFVFTATG